MKADIEKVLKEIGNDRHGLSDLIMHYGSPKEIEMAEWENVPINVLQDQKHSLNYSPPPLFLH